MKQIFQYGDYSYEYFIELGERKSYTLVLCPDLRIIARVPLGATFGEIEKFLARKWLWLEKQLRELRKYRKPSSEELYVSGKSLYYLGRQYMIEVILGQADTVKLERGKLRVYTTKTLRNSDHNKKLVNNWYATRRNGVFKREYIKAFQLFNYEKIPQLGERTMARRWGSYTSDGRVLLNPRLIEASREAIHYVCVHELCHKISRKHDEKFYNELDRRLPHWRRIKESLEVRHG